MIKWEDTPGIPSEGFQPLAVTATVPGQIYLPSGRLALDSLLAAKVCLLQHVPPPSNAAEVLDVSIPIETDAQGIPLCSFSLGSLHEHDKRYRNRRPPIEQYQEMGCRGTVNISLGVEKAYHTQYQSSHLEDEELTWYCIGDKLAIEYLLTFVRFLGKRTAVGYGKVESWEVISFPPAWDGFPVVREGRPLRPLPLGYSGLSPDAKTGYGCIRYPYWDQSREELCAIPC